MERAPGVTPVPPSYRSWRGFHPAEILPSRDGRSFETTARRGQLWYVGPDFAATQDPSAIPIVIFYVEQCGRVMGIVRFAKGLAEKSGALVPVQADRRSAECR